MSTDDIMTCATPTRAVSFGQQSSFFRSSSNSTLWAASGPLFTFLPLLRSNGAGRGVRLYTAIGPMGLWD